MKLKNYLLLAVFPLFLGDTATAQSINSTIYTYEIQLSNSADMDYRMEQQAFLFEKMIAIPKLSSFNKERLVYVVRTKVNYSTTELKSEIEAKGITVIGAIVKSTNHPNSNTH